MENPTRRRVLAAGLTGTALGLTGGRAVSAGTIPPSDAPSDAPSDSEPATTATATTDPPDLPTEADVELLGFAQAAELAAHDLYQVSIDDGVDDRVVTLMRDNHEANAQVIAGMLGVNAVGSRDEGLYGDQSSSFEETDVRALSATAYELESTLVATHTDLLRSLEGIHGARLIASIIIVEAQHCTVLADLAGNGDDLDALFVNDAEPLTVASAGGG